jgi:hypothetical protein
MKFELGREYTLSTWGVYYFTINEINETSGYMSVTVFYRVNNSIMTRNYVIFHSSYHLIIPYTRQEKGQFILF